MADRFYLYRGTVARYRETPTTVEIAVWDVRLRRWVLAPGIVGEIVGTGGDPALDRISREDADRILAKYPPLAEAPRMTREEILAKIEQPPAEHAALLELAAAIGAYLDEHADDVEVVIEAEVVDRLLSAIDRGY